MKKYNFEVLNENIMVDSYIVYQILKRLVIPFNKMKAFELGIIDQNGKVLKSKKSLNPEEKQAFTILDILVINLKKLLGKLPMGKTAIASFAAALFLIKEQNNEKMCDDDLMYESFRDFLDNLNFDENYMLKAEKLMQDLQCEEIANSSSAAIAGVGDGTVVVKEPPSLLKRKTFLDFVED